MLKLARVPLLLALLLLVVGRAASSDGGRAVRCLNLQPADEICAEAGEGFSFYDGCNRVRCLAGGLAASTRRLCPLQSSAEDVEHCVSVAFAVFDRMPGRACPNAVPEAICASRRGYGGGDFTDGCNSFDCALDGSVAGIAGKERSCPPGRADSKLCQFVESLNVVSARHLAALSGSTRRRRRSKGHQQQQQQFACPQLAASEICGPSTNGFSYSDGCNTITCHADGTGTSTFMACPRPTEAAADQQDAAVAFCQAAEREMRLKMERSSLRDRCLRASQVCVGEAVSRRLIFNDGCNRCICMAVGEAACTRRSCPKVLMTDEEFRGYCNRRGADRR